MVNKRGQVKIQQMAFLLITLTILFVMVGMFALKAGFSGLEDERAELQQASAIKLVSRLANTPELACGEVFGGERANCVDFDKAIVFKKQSKNYANFWGVEGLEIIKIYPFSDEICTLDNYQDCGFLKIIDNQGKGKDRSAFISLCRKAGANGRVYDKCELAKLVVRYSDDE